MVFEMFLALFFNEKSANLLIPKSIGSNLVEIGVLECLIFNPPAKLFIPRGGFDRFSGRGRWLVFHFMQLRSAKYILLI